MIWGYHYFWKHPYGKKSKRGHRLKKLLGSSQDLDTWLGINPLINGAMIHGHVRKTSHVARSLGDENEPWLLTRWWFETCFIYTPTWGNDPIWLIFFRWVGSTTNQLLTTYPSPGMIIPSHKFIGVIESPCLFFSNLGKAEVGVNPKIVVFFPPKSSILIGFPSKNHPFWVFSPYFPLFLETPSYSWIYLQWGIPGCPFHCQAMFLDC